MAHPNHWGKTKGKVHFNGLSPAGSEKDLRLQHGREPAPTQSLQPLQG
jgi:hypothetical protein